MPDPQPVAVPREVLEWIADKQSRPGPRNIVYIAGECSGPMFHADDLATYALALRGVVGDLLPLAERGKKTVKSDVMRVVAKERIDRARALLGDDA